MAAAGAAALNLQGTANQVRQAMQQHIPDISVSATQDNKLSILYGGVAIGGAAGFFDDYTEYKYDPATRILTKIQGDDMNDELRNTLIAVIENALGLANMHGGRRHRKSRKSHRKSRKTNRKATRRASRKSRRTHRR